MHFFMIILFYIITDLYSNHQINFSFIDNEKIPNIEENRKKYNLLSWKLNIGDVIAFNFSTVHGAPGNSSKNRRRAFSVRFVGDDATFAKRKGEISPPFPEVILNHGDKMDCESFPQIKL